MSWTNLYSSMFAVLILIGFTTSATAQGTSGPVIGGESRGITQIRGKVLCVDCTLADVRSGLNRTTRHWDTQAASCEGTASELSATRSAVTASVTSGV